MNYQEYLQADNELQNQIFTLEERRKQLEHEYLSQFPGVGDPVLYRGEKMFIHKVERWLGKDPLYTLCRPKKDGTPSQGGRKEYGVLFHQIQVVNIEVE